MSDKQRQQRQAAPGLVDAMARRMQANLSRATTPPRRAPRRSDVVYRLRVTLDGTEPPIWRLLEVAGDSTLGGLSGAIMDAMPWGAEHLYGLTIDGREYGPKMVGAFGPTSLDEEDYRLSEVVTQIGEAFTFTYDYGDNWSHTCVVEAIAPLEPGADYPREVGRERAAPPEDVGGVGGFYEWIVACLDPSDPEHEWMLERAEGEGWTPARMAQEWLTPAQHEAWKAGRSDWMEA